MFQNVFNKFIIYCTLFQLCFIILKFYNLCASDIQLILMMGHFFLLFYYFLARIPLINVARGMFQNLFNKFKIYCTLFQFCFTLLKLYNLYASDGQLILMMGHFFLLFYFFLAGIPLINVARGMFQN